MNLYIDIETIPAQRPDILAEIREKAEAELQAKIADVRAPSNYGAEAADKWMQTKGAEAIQSMRDGVEAEIDEAYRRTALDGAFGQVCVIGWAVDDEPARTVQGMNEASVLYGFSKALKIGASSMFNTCVIGHNVAAFDLRFLVQRHIVNGIKPHAVIARAAQAKPWESEKVFDTMVQWGGPSARPGGSLDKLCKALGIPSPKTDITGATVWDAVKAGRLDDVARYCARDVEATREIHKRITFQSAAVEAAA